MHRVLMFLKFWWTERLESAVFTVLIVCALCGLIGAVYCTAAAVPYVVISLGFPEFAATFPSSIELYKFCSGLVIFGIICSSFFVGIYIWLSSLVEDAKRFWKKSKSGL